MLYIFQICTFDYMFTEANVAGNVNEDYDRGINVEIIPNPSYRVITLPAKSN